MFDAHYVLLLLLFLLLFVAVAGTVQRTTLLQSTQLPVHVLHGVFGLQSGQNAQPHLHMCECYTKHSSSGQSSSMLNL